MKRYFLILLLFLIVTISVAAESTRTYFPSLFNNPILPNDSKIGQIVDATEDNYAILKVALESGYSFDWVESFVHESMKKPITELFSGYLSSILPLKDFYMSSGFKNGDESISICVRFDENILTFIVLNGKIIAIQPEEDVNLFEYMVKSPN